MYVYESPVGTFQIEERDGDWHLSFDDDVLGKYRSAAAAADDVYLHATGCCEWDSLEGKVADVPPDVYEWEEVR